MDPISVLFLRHYNTLIHYGLRIKEGSLIFKYTPLLNALFEIEDIYGIPFIIRTDALKKETISGGVPIKDLYITLKYPH